MTDRRLRPNLRTRESNMKPPSETLATTIAPLLKPKDLAQILGVSVRMVERLRSAGAMPQPDIFLGRLPRWKATTISAWLDRGGK
jgi:predicted DNA-binding transcriptional regulator AlpA